jgi:hypothetical protein
MPEPDAPQGRQPAEHDETDRPGDERSPADDVRDEDPEAPGIGAIDGGDDIDDLPEPQEPA